MLDEMKEHGFVDKYIKFQSTQHGKIQLMILNQNKFRNSKTTEISTCLAFNHIRTMFSQA